MYVKVEVHISAIEVGLYLLRFSYVIQRWREGGGAS